MSLESSVRRARCLLEIASEFRTGVWAREACRCSSDIIEDIMECWASPESVKATVLPLMTQLLDGVVGIKEDGHAVSWGTEIDVFANNIRDRLGRVQDYISRQTPVFSALF